MSIEKELPHKSEAQDRGSQTRQKTFTQMTLLFKLNIAEKTGAISKIPDQVGV